MSEQQLQTRLGYTFSDAKLLTRALSHRSVGAGNNERLEFLGDSVVNQVVAEAIFRAFPTAREGDMSRMRATLVKGDTLADMARELDLGSELILGAGERRSGGHRRASILADAFEAIVGAILLDSDYMTTRDLLLGWYRERLAEIDTDSGKDAKTLLQELLQGAGKGLPDYVLINVSGEGHDQRFEVSCHVPAYDMKTLGEGSSRRKAEQQAAQRLLEQFQER